MDSLDHKERERRSNDLIAVFNPTMEDYAVVWNGYKHVVPNCNRNTGSGVGMKVLPRYIAEKYCTEMTDKLILNSAALAVAKENDERVNKRKLKKMDAWEEQLAFERPLMVDNADLRREILPTLWKGLVEHYGMEGTVDASAQKVETRLTDEQIFDELDTPYQPVEEAAPVSPTEAAAAEVAE